MLKSIFIEIIVVFYYVSKCDIVHCKGSDDSLEFWKRDPKFESTAIPKTTGERKTTRLTGEKMLEEIYSRLNRSNISRHTFDQSLRKTGIKLEEIFQDSGARRVLDKQVLAHELPKQRAQLERKENANQVHVAEKDPKSQAGKEEVQQKETLGTEKKTGKDNGEKELWPRVRDYESKRRGIIKSTRMTPMYLMQQPPESTQMVPSSHKKDGDDEIQLTPYNIKSQLEALALKFPDVNITLEVIGKTVEYNDIVLLKAAAPKASKYFRSGTEDKYVDEVPEKKIVFIVHALNVMGYKYMLCFHEEKSLKTLLSYYFKHLDKFNIYIIPMANPDGTSVIDDIWNKNMSPQSACPGVNLDRNFDIAWNSTKTISSCSQQFPGKFPFSEHETLAIKEIFHRYGRKIAAYLNVHAGTYNIAHFKGDAVLYPKGYTDVQSDDDRYIDLRAEIHEALNNASFRVMSVLVDTLQHWYGTVTGSSVDYANTVYGIPYSMELVMQIYSDLNSLDFNLISLGDRVSNAALQELWRRIIDVIFNNISRNMQKVE